MDDFIAVLKRALAGMARGPVLLTAGLLAGLVSALGLIQNSPIGAAVQDGTAGLAESVIVIAAVFLVPILVMPFLTSGSLGAVLDRIGGGKGGWDRFIAAAKKYYPRVMFASLGAMIIYYTLSFMLIILIALGSASPAIMLLLLIPAFVIMFVVLMAIEFYDVAIVAHDRDIFQAFGESVGFVRKHIGTAVAFFAIVIVAKTITMIPMYTLVFLKSMAKIAGNITYYDNGTANLTALNETVNSTALFLESNTFSLPSLAAIMVLQGLIQVVVFAFVISFKAEYFSWAGNVKKITDFDYDFSQDKDA